MRLCSNLQKRRLGGCGFGARLDCTTFDHCRYGPACQDVDWQVEQLLRCGRFNYSWRFASCQGFGQTAQVSWSDSAVRAAVTPFNETDIAPGCNAGSLAEP